MYGTSEPAKGEEQDDGDVCKIKTFGVLQRW